MSILKVKWFIFAIIYNNLRCNYDFCHIYMHRLCLFVLLLLQEHQTYSYTQLRFYLFLFSAFELGPRSRWANHKNATFRKSLERAF